MNTIAKNNQCAPSNKLWFDDFFTREVDRLFSHQSSRTSATPSANIWDDEKSLFIEMVIPGINKEDVKVKLENNLLNITAEHTSQTEESNKRFIRKEFGKLAYSRSFKLNQDDYQIADIEAAMNNGVLLITVPKKVVEKQESSHIISVK